MAKLGCFHNDDLVYIELEKGDNTDIETLRNKIVMNYLDFFADLGISGEVCEPSNEIKRRRADRCETCFGIYRTSMEKGYVWFQIEDAGLLTVNAIANNGDLEKLLQFIRNNFPEWEKQTVDVFFRHYGSNWYYLTSIDKILKKYAVKKPCPLTDEDAAIISRRTDRTDKIV